MSYKITKQDKYIEVSLLAGATKWDVIQAVGGLRQRNPLKEFPDVWILDEEVVIPFSDFENIMNRSLVEFPKDMHRTPSAIVVQDAFQLEMARLYVAELAAVPYEIRVFTNKEEAVAWIQQYDLIKSK